MSGRLSEVYQLWLKGKHLPGDGSVREAIISQAVVEDTFPRPKVKQRAVVVSFEGKQHRLILSNRLANEAYDILGDDYTKWPGKAIGLYRTGNNQVTLVKVDQPESIIK